MKATGDVTKELGKPVGAQLSAECPESCLVIRGSKPSAAQNE